VCRCTIQDPVPARNYFHIAHRDICEACHDALESSVKPVIRTKQPFDYGWYNNLVQESIEKAIQKGKW
jgi:hypothetical protein